MGREREYQYKSVALGSYYVKLLSMKGTPILFYTTSLSRPLAQYNASKRHATEGCLVLSYSTPPSKLPPIIYESKVKLTPTLWVAWSSFWVSKEPPRPRVTPGRRRTL